MVSKFSPSHEHLSTWLENYRHEGRCQIPSAIFEFFQIASEMWLLCVAFDLAVTMSNPFSSFRARSSLCFLICIPDSFPPSLTH
jgi:hypothetical protein